jgi:hypothetical protein
VPESSKTAFGEPKSKVWAELLQIFSIFPNHQNISHSRKKVYFPPSRRDFHFILAISLCYLLCLNPKEPIILYLADWNKHKLPNWTVSNVLNSGLIDEHDLVVYPPPKPPASSRDWYSLWANRDK